VARRECRVRLDVHSRGCVELVAEILYLLVEIRLVLEVVGVDVALGQPSVAKGVVVKVANVEVQPGILRLAVLDELEYLRVRELGGRDGSRLSRSSPRRTRSTRRPFGQCSSRAKLGIDEPGQRVAELGRERSADPLYYLVQASPRRGGFGVRRWPVMRGASQKS
jgi:hypothetical protein